MAAKARTARLVIEEVGDDTVVYDLDNHRAHCLNRPAGLVWRAADGRRTPRQIAARVGKELGAPFPEAGVTCALEDLARAHLLDGAAAKRAPFSGSRRRMIRNLLIAPVVLSILAPTEAQAASCFKTKHPCTFNTQCCSGLCIGGRCA